MYEFILAKYATTAVRNVSSFRNVHHALISSEVSQPSRPNASVSLASTMMEPTLCASHAMEHAQHAVTNRIPASHAILPIIVNWSALNAYVRKVTFSMVLMLNVRNAKTYVKLALVRRMLVFHAFLPKIEYWIKPNNNAIAIWATSNRTQKIHASIVIGNAFHVSHRLKSAPLVRMAQTEACL
jgi:hypothetical protein